MGFQHRCWTSITFAINKVIPGDPAGCRPWTQCMWPTHWGVGQERIGLCQLQPMDKCGFAQRMCMEHCKSWKVWRIRDLPIQSGGTDQVVTSSVPPLWMGRSRRNATYEPGLFCFGRPPRMLCDLREMFKVGGDVPYTSYSKETNPRLCVWCCGVVLLVCVGLVEL
eukprot:gene9603-biopygen21246